MNTPTLSRVARNAMRAGSDRVEVSTGASCPPGPIDRARVSVTMRLQEADDVPRTQVLRLSVADAAALGRRLLQSAVWVQAAHVADATAGGPRLAEVGRYMPDVGAVASTLERVERELVQVQADGIIESYAAAFKKG